MKLPSFLQIYKPWTRKYRMNGMYQYIQNLALNQFQEYKSIIDK